MRSLPLEQGQHVKFQWTFSQVSPNLTLQSSIFVSFQSIHHSKSLSSHFSKFKALKILSLDAFLLRTRQTEELVASVLRVEVLHLPFYCLDESNSQDEDFTEETLLSTVLSSEGLPSVKETVIPSKPITLPALETASPRSLKLWKEAREVLEGNEMIKSGKVNLKTLEMGETSE